MIAVAYVALVVLAGANWLTFRHHARKLNAGWAALAEERRVLAEWSAKVTVLYVRQHPESPLGQAVGQLDADLQDVAARISRPLLAAFDDEGSQP